jgi:putative oxidoreductase
MNLERHTQIVMLIGRLLIGGLYLWSGISNFVELNGKAAYAASKGLPAPAVFVALASLLLMVGSLSIVTGLRPQLGVAAIALFLIPVTLIMHNFWVLDGIQRITELHSFQGNLGLLGSVLMLLAIPRPWPLSLDHWIAALRTAVRKQRVRNTA